MAGDIVEVAREGEIAVISVNNPPVNTITAAVRAGEMEFMLVNTAATEVTFASREDTSHAPILRLTMADTTVP